MDLSPWLRFRPEEAPDIIVLGYAMTGQCVLKKARFQELDLTAEALLFNDSTREEVALHMCVADKSRTGPGLLNQPFTRATRTRRSDFLRPV